MAIAGYNFYENGVKLNSSLLTIPNYVRTGLGEGVSGTCYFTAVDDAGNESSAGDTKPFTTLTAAPGNTAPVANAGPDQTITAGNTLYLSGTGTDSDGTIASYLWEKVSGGSASISTPTASATNITGLSAGSYVFRLTVTDNSGAIGTDTVTIEVVKEFYEATFDLDPSQGITTSGTSVTAVTGSSPNKFASTAISAGQQPVLVPNVLNGLPVLRFAGAQHIPFGSDVQNIGQNSLTVYAVVNMSNMAGWIYTKSVALSDANRYGLGYSSITGTPLASQLWLNSVSYQSTTPLATGEWVIITQRIDRVAQKNQLWIGETMASETSIGAASNYNAVSMNPFRIGASTASDRTTPTGFMSGDIARLLLFTRATAHTEQEMSEHRNTLRQKFNLPL